MRVTIVGGGVAGLALAHELAPEHEVLVLESSPGPRGGGYMIDFFGPGFAAAERMGIIDELRSRGRVFDGVRYVRDNGGKSAWVSAASLVEAARGRYFSILRPEVENALLTVLPASVEIRYDARVQTVGQTGDRAWVELADGEQIEADLVVGCDGVHSVIGEFVNPGQAVIAPMGYRAASYVFYDERLAGDLDRWALMTDTIDRVAGLYACDDRQVAVFLAERVDAKAPMDRIIADRDRLRSKYAGLHPDVDSALELAPERFYDDYVAQTYPPRWSRGRVALLGDAAYAVSLLAGQGTSLAIAGAEVLAASLSEAGSGSSASVEDGLADYERRWRPVTERAQRSGRRGASAFIPAGRLQLGLLRAGRGLLDFPGVARLLGRHFIAS